ncbi:hypothetical protein [Lentiprolixibacter aurantiacus]|uniref:Uncharacterized protein n=1 Tax=Lentiprolixibacter aurantiacus TaxID=2993939 RepID=A0AAE3MJS6_9FLAO|nr:hypothetical protein [Lentiprolixibacter aurantiacus]MCX2718417.1 hypothetical protein [Lentiprolixibacter aurantiacus]
MHKRPFHNGILFILLLGVILMFSECGVSKKRKYQREYRRLWKEIIQSQAWKDALRSSRTFTYIDSELRYIAVGPSDLKMALLPDSERTREVFEQSYNGWVKQAYFRIIAEAEEADAGIRAEYERLQEVRKDRDSLNKREFREKLLLAKRRYQAHKQMLEGLKSWKAFDEYGSDDLEFFSAENKDLVYELFRTGQKETTIVAYLMYKLADLYHQED